MKKLKKTQRKDYFSNRSFDLVSEQRTACFFEEKFCFPRWLIKARRTYFSQSTFLSVFWESGQPVFSQKKAVFPRRLIKQKNDIFQIGRFECVLEKRTTCILVTKCYFPHWLIINKEENYYFPNRPFWTLFEKVDNMCVDKKICFIFLPADWRNTRKTMFSWIGLLSEFWSFFEIGLLNVFSKKWTTCVFSKKNMFFLPLI